MNEKKNSNDEPKDWFLSAIVRQANNNQVVGLCVTLNVQGILITGELISYARYFDESALYLTDRNPGPDAAAYFKNLTEEAKKAADNFNKENSDLLENVGYIHLRNARSLVGDRFVPDSEGVLWRIALKDVSSFTWGRLEKR